MTLFCIIQILLDKLILIECFINVLFVSGEELTTLNHLVSLRLFCERLILSKCSKLEYVTRQYYYLSTEVDLQEQVIRLQKLHHVLELVLTCSTFLGLPYDRLFLLSQ